MSCGITAICAITGKAPGQVVAAGLIRSPHDDARFQDQLRTLEVLGCRLLDHNHNPIRAIDFPRDRRWTEGQLGEQANMGQFLTRLGAHPPPDVLMVHATRINRETKELESHTLVVESEWYFDNNTPEGKPVPLLQAPEN